MVAVAGVADAATSVATYGNWSCSIGRDRRRRLRAVLRRGFERGSAGAELAEGRRFFAESRELGAARFAELFDVDAALRASVAVDELVAALALRGFFRARLSFTSPPGSIECDRWTCELARQHGCSLRVLDATQEQTDDGISRRGRHP